MFENLPRKIQEEVMNFLRRNDFSSAKLLYDLWAKGLKQGRTEL